jgi:hypothetical protein
MHAPLNLSSTNKNFSGSELGGRLVPNDGFLPTAVVPLGSSLEAVLGDDTHGQDNDDEEEGGNVGVEGATMTAGLVPTLQSMVLDTSPAASIASLCTASEAVPAVPADMDALLELTLLQALSRAVKDSDLPLAGSVLWVQHMLACRPAGSVLGRY